MEGEPSVLVIRANPSPFGIIFVLPMLLGILAPRVFGFRVVIDGSPIEALRPFGVVDIPLAAGRHEISVNSFAGSGGPWSNRTIELAPGARAELILQEPTTRISQPRMRLSGGFLIPDEIDGFEIGERVRLKDRPELGIGTIVRFGPGGADNVMMAAIDFGRSIEVVDLDKEIAITC